jgi:hypothetical protein
MADALSIGLMLAGLAFAVYVVVVLFELVGDMAGERGHPAGPWYIVALCTSPFTAILLLWLFYDVEDADTVVPDQE